MRADIIVIRAVFTVILVTAGYLIRPIPALGGKWYLSAQAISAAAGLLIALGIIFFELRTRQATLKTLIGAAIGSTLES
jgi:hypothetical protein